MRYDSITPVLATLLILLGAIVSGPLVGAVDISEPPADQGTAPVPGDGTATVSVISTPESATIESTRFAAEGYLIDVPNATIDVTNLTGHPMVVYKLRIPELTYVGGTTTVLNRNFTGRQELTMRQLSIDGEEEMQDEYRGELLIVKREHEQDTTLYQGNVTISVKR